MLFAPFRGVFPLRRTKTATPRLWLSGFILLATFASSSQVASSTAEIKSPDLNLILQRLEDIQHQDPAQSRPYEVIREYKVLRGYIRNLPLRSWPRSISFLPTRRHTRLFRQTVTRGEKEWFASFWTGKLTRRRKYTVTRSLGRTMTLFFLGERTSASFLSTF